MIDFEKILISKETGLQNRIQAALSQYPKFQSDIDWKEYEYSKDRFMEFSIDKLSKSMAYEIELMPKSKATSRLERWINKFEDDCRFFTNWDLGMDGTSGYSWIPVTDHTYDCCLIIIDQFKIGIIVMIDED
ncbi:MAG: hypothetical protein AAFN93_15685 [Bacteroidota bacterium]